MIALVFMQVLRGGGGSSSKLLSLLRDDWRLPHSRLKKPLFAGGPLSRLAPCAVVLVATPR